MGVDIGEIIKKLQFSSYKKIYNIVIIIPEFD